MEFQKRLEKAIERGQKAGTARAEAEARQAMNEQEIRRLHSQYRLELSERIEDSLKQVADHFPGFQFAPLINERGWGASVSRDDLDLKPGRPVRSFFSRLDILIRPVSSAQVLELTAKGTIRNKELFNRTYFQRLTEVDLTSFHETMDLWVLEFAESFAAQN
jgi:hypothetical protein